ncbi:uncharacterized protein [Clytia hemisphaerica]|uniref:Uncharacterized protein n=1 Tax=Clytia hemisphaerica TaxID=252671 RepID=A0A7M5V9L7_9CNID
MESHDNHQNNSTLETVEVKAGEMTGPENMGERKSDKITGSENSTLQKEAASIGYNQPTENTDTRKHQWYGGHEGWNGGTLGRWRESDEIQKAGADNENVDINLESDQTHGTGNEEMSFETHGTENEEMSDQIDDAENEETNDKTHGAEKRDWNCWRRRWCWRKMARIMIINDGDEI